MKRRSAARIGVNSRDPDHRGDVGDNRLLKTFRRDMIVVGFDIPDPGAALDTTRFLTIVDELFDLVHFLDLKSQYGSPA